VGATDRYDDRASFSTFGSDWVSLLAPGENIISTVPNELCVFYADLLGLVFDPDNEACLDWYSGTSMASPHVAGAAALVWAHLFPGQLADPSTCEMAPGVQCNQVVRQHLEDGADTEGALGQNMLAWSQHGRLNVAGALTAVAPPTVAPEILSLSGNTDGTATVEWDYRGLIQLQREKLHVKRGAWRSLTTVWSGTPDAPIGTNPSYTDDSGAGTFHYRVGATLPDSSVMWGEWSNPTEVTDSGSVKGGGKGGGKPKK
jgi:subtilisin family serine protease